MAKRKRPASVKRRNPLHDAPQLRKCAAHGKTKKARRKQDKMTLRKEWCCPLGWYTALMDNIIPNFLLPLPHPSR